MLPSPPQKLKIRDPLIAMNSYGTEADVIITKADFRRAFPDSTLSTKPKMVLPANIAKSLLLLELVLDRVRLIPPLQWEFRSTAAGYARFYSGVWSLN